MALPLSLGDLTTLCNLSWQVYKLCKDASDSFRNVSSEVLSLHAVLRVAEESLAKHSFSDSKFAGLATVISGCCDVLSDLETLVEKYKKLGTKTQRVWDRIGWHTEDIAELRLRLISNTGLLTAFISSSQLAVEQKLNQLLQDFKNGHQEASVITTETVASIAADDEQSWRAIRKELEDIGISVEAFESNKPFIMKWFREALERGDFEEQQEDVDSENEVTGQLAFSPGRMLFDDVVGGLRYPIEESTSPVSQLELTDDAHSQLDSLSLSHGRPKIENASAPKVVRDGTSSPPSQPSEEPSAEHRFGKDQIGTAGMLLKSQRPLADDPIDRNLADALKSEDITPRTIFSNTKQDVRPISMSPDGTLLVGVLSPENERQTHGGQSGPAIYKQEMTRYLRIWNTATGNEVSSTSFIGSVLAISFHPDSRTISLFCKHAELEGLLCNKITWSARVALWGVSTDLALQFELPDYRYGEVECARFSRDCRLLAMFDPETPFGKDDNRRVHIWNRKAGHYERELSFKLRETDYSPIGNWKRRAVEISTDNQLIAVSESYTVCVLSCNTGNELFRLEHSRVVVSLSFSLSENALAIFCGRKNSYSKDKYPSTGVQETSFGSISVFVDIWSGFFVRSPRSSSTQEPMLLTCTVNDDTLEGNPEIRGFRSGRVLSKLQPTRVDRYCFPRMALSLNGTKLAVAYSKEEDGIDYRSIDIWEARG